MSVSACRNGSLSIRSTCLNSRHPGHINDRPRTVYSFPKRQQLAWPPIASSSSSSVASRIRQPRYFLFALKRSPSPFGLTHSSLFPSRAASTITSTTPAPPAIPSLSPSSTTPVSPPSISLQPNIAKPSSPTSPLNPSSSTHPPPLSLPTRDPLQSIFRYYLSLGRAYLTFYKSALRSIISNRRTSLTLLSRSSLPRTLLFTSTARLFSAAQSGTLSRADFQTIFRSRSDVRRIPLFALVFAACGEFTPLLVPWLSGVVPRSAWIPGQVEKEQKKRWRKREEGWRRLQQERAIGLGQGISTRDQVEELSREELLHVSRSLGLHARAWDVLWENPPLWLIRWRVRGRVAYLEVDDELTGRDGGWERLNEKDIGRAADERGCDGLGMDEGELRRRLGWWFRSRTGEGRSVLGILCEALELKGKGEK